MKVIYKHINILLLLLLQRFQIHSLPTQNYKLELLKQSNALHKLSLKVERPKLVNNFSTKNNFKYSKLSIVRRPLIRKSLYFELFI